MAITLKEENVLNEWSMIIDHAAGKDEGLIRDIENRLQESEIPGGCDWSIQEVKSSTWVSRVRRDFLVVKLDQFRDYRMYIAARDYGVHLDVCRFLTAEPGGFKKMISSRLTGDAQALSAPKNILVHQDLTAWVTVVHHCVLDAVEALMKELNQDIGKIRRGSKGFLEVW